MNAPRYQDTNRSRGYAHITFSSQKAVKKALKLDKSYMGERYIEVTEATGKKQVIVKSSQRF
jgi:RNA recognition motif-containing protein